MILIGKTGTFLEASVLVLIGQTILEFELNGSITKLLKAAAKFMNSSL